MYVPVTLSSSARRSSSIEASGRYVVVNAPPALHHHVEAAAVRHHPGDDLVDLAFDRDVAAETGRVEPSGAELRGDSLASRRVPAGQIHRCAELGQGLGHRSAEVRPAPGHDRDAAGEVEEGLDSHAGDHSSTGWRPAEGDPPVR
jgi:hypothetical protein